MANPSQSSVKASRAHSGGTPPAAARPAPQEASLSPGQLLTLALSWAGVGLPLAWGVLQTFEKALALFK